MLYKQLYSIEICKYILCMYLKHQILYFTYFFYGLRYQVSTIITVEIHL